MSTAPECPVFRVWRGQKLVGNAFPVHPSYLLTCTHVVATAVTGNREKPVANGVPVTVDCPSDGRAGRIEAILERHLPFAGDDGSRDLALLRLPDNGSAIDSGLPWWRKQAVGDPVAAFGCRDETGYKSGIWHEGLIRGSNAHGWHQVDRPQAGGADVAGGISGSPVLNRERNAVLGIVTTADTAAGLWQFIPYDLVQKFCIGHLPLSLHLDDDDALTRVLTRLDYNDQAEVAFGFEDAPLCAFIVHGPRGHGQLLLAHRLVKGWTTGHKAPAIIRIDFGAASPATLPSVLGQIQQCLAGRHGEPAARLLPRLHQRRRTGPVVLVVSLGQATSATDMRALLEEFWAPLVEAAPDSSPGLHRLGMVVVDPDDRWKDWEIPAAREHGPDWQPAVPVALPALTRFPPAVLRRWLGETVPAIYDQRYHADLARHLHFSGGEGMPEDVIDQFCRCFQRQWYGGLETCLRPS